MSPQKVVYSCKFFRVLYSQVKNAIKKKSFYVVDFGPRAGVVLSRHNQILLVRQFRFLPNDFSWELPGGTVNSDENPEDGARRECREESGFVCKKLDQLVVYYPGLDNVNNETSVFHCGDFLQDAEFNFSGDEVIETKWFHIDEAVRMVQDAKILDAMTIVGLLSYKLKVAS